MPELLLAPFPTRLGICWPIWLHCWQVLRRAIGREPMTVGSDSKFRRLSRQSLGNSTKRSSPVPSLPLVSLAVVSVEALLFWRRAGVYRQRRGAEWHRVLLGTTGSLVLLLRVDSHMCVRSVVGITASLHALPQWRVPPVQPVVSDLQSFVTVELLCAHDLCVFHLLSDHC